MNHFLTDLDSILKTATEENDADEVATPIIPANPLVVGAFVKRGPGANVNGYAIMKKNFKPPHRYEDMVSTEELTFQTVKNGRVIYGFDTAHLWDQWKYGKLPDYPRMTAEQMVRDVQSRTSAFAGALWPKQRIAYSSYQ